MRLTSSTSSSIGGREDISREPDTITTIDKASAFDAECLHTKNVQNLLQPLCIYRGFGGYMPPILVFIVFFFFIYGTDNTLGRKVLQ